MNHNSATSFQEAVEFVCEWEKVCRKFQDLIRKYPKIAEIPLTHVSLDRVNVSTTAIKKMYEDGASIQQVAKEFGISPSAVYKRLKRADVEMRQKRRRKTL